MKYLVLYKACERTAREGWAESHCLGPWCYWIFNSLTKDQAYGELEYTRRHYQDMEFTVIAGQRREAERRR